MITRLPVFSRRRPARQSGFILVTGLLFLVVLTLLGLAMFRSSGLMDRISANTRDKQRAFEAAESALQYGEWWLSNNNGGVGGPCSGLASGDTLTNVHVCSNPLPANYAATVPFANAFTYTPPGLKVVAGGGGISTSNANDVNYATLPGFYIEYLGLNADSTQKYYQVTAYGSGGNVDTASVVRSTYMVKSTVKDLGAL